MPEPIGRTDGARTLERQVFLPGDWLKLAFLPGFERTLVAEPLQDLFAHVMVRLGEGDMPASADSEKQPAEDARVGGPEHFVSLPNPGGGRTRPWRKRPPGGVMGSEKTAEHDRLFTEYVISQLEQLRRLAYVLSQDVHRADDLVQEAITKLYLNWHNKHKVLNLDRYVRAIVVREFLNSQRLGWARRVRLSASLPEGRRAHAGSVEDRLVLREALKQMPPRQRAVVVLRFMCDLSVQEVADTLGCSEGTVKSQTAAGLVTLRRHLGKFLLEDGINARRF